MAHLPLRWVYRNRSALEMRSQPRNDPRLCRSLSEKLPQISAGTVIWPGPGRGPATSRRAADGGAARR